MDPVRVLAGSTAIGKTEGSLLLAERLGAEIISIDSRQVFRGLEIGSAAPTPGERARVPHHLVGEFDPEEPLTAGEFGRQVERRLEEIAARDGRTILVGGSGLYLQAALGGLDDLPRDPELRDQFRTRLAAEGPQRLYDELVALDPETAALLAPRDSTRVIRALVITRVAGRPASELRTRGRSMPRPSRVVVLDRQRPDHDDRIRRRIEQMIGMGLVDEVRALLARGLDPGGTVLKSVGYAETIAYLNGELDSASWREAMFRNTRRFAKRQRTWFRRLPDATWLTLAPGEPPEVWIESVEEAWASPGPLDRSPFRE